MVGIYSHSCIETVEITDTHCLHKLCMPSEAHKLPSTHKVELWLQNPGKIQADNVTPQWALKSFQPNASLWCEETVVECFLKLEYNLSTSGRGCVEV